MYILFFSIFLSVFGLLNYYLGLRVWQLLGGSLHLTDMTVYWLVFTAIVLSGILGTVGNKLFPLFLRSGIYLAASYWLAAMTYLIIFFVIADFVQFLSKRTAILSAAVWDSAAFPFTPGLVVIPAVLILLIYGTWNGRNIKIRSYEINIPKRKGSLNQLHIAMFSDAHFGPVNDNRQKKIVNAINSLNADIVLIPGDIIDDIDLYEKQGIAAALKNIKSKYGIYASLGNHDYFNKELSRHEKLLNETGVKLLRDSSVKVAGSLFLVGREDRYYELRGSHKRKELRELMQDLEPGLPVIMLDHQPLGLAAAAEAGVDLLLSGHTHKGQFFPFNWITGRIFEVDHGYLEKDGLQVVVSCGAATWGPPVRIGTRSEVVSVKVNFMDKLEECTGHQSPALSCR